MQKYEIFYTIAILTDNNVLTNAQIAAGPGRITGAIQQQLINCYPAQIGDGDVDAKQKGYDIRIRVTIDALHAFNEGMITACLF